MVGVAFNFGGASLVTLGQHTESYAAKLHGSSKKERFAAGDHGFGRFNVRHDFFGQASGAGGQPTQGQRGTHQFQKVTAAEGGEPLISPLGKLVFQETLKFISFGQFFQAAPIFLTVQTGQALSEGRYIEILSHEHPYLWQIEQLSSLPVSTLYSLTSWAPIVSWSWPGGNSQPAVKKYNR